MPYVQGLHHAPWRRQAGMLWAAPISMISLAMSKARAPLAVVGSGIRAAGGISLDLLWSSCSIDDGGGLDERNP